MAGFRLAPGHHRSPDVFQMSCMDNHEYFGHLSEAVPAVPHGNPCLSPFIFQDDLFTATEPCASQTKDIRP